MSADRTLLTDEMWEDLSPLLPGQAWSCGVTAADTRGFVEAVLWLGRTGAPWRDLPAHLGQWHRVYVRFARWRDKGVWEQVTAWLVRNKRQIPHSQQCRCRWTRRASGCINTARELKKKRRTGHRP